MREGEGEGDSRNASLNLLPHYKGRQRVRPAQATSLAKALPRGMDGEGREEEVEVKREEKRRG